MVSRLICLLALICSGTARGETPEERSSERSFHEISRELRSLLRVEALAKTPLERAAVIGDMCKLHTELLHDPRFDTSTTLAKYRAKLWARLQKIEKQLGRELARQKPVNKPSDLSFNASDLSVLDITTDRLAKQMGLIGVTLGGAADLLLRNAGAGGGAAGGLQAENLIDLIQRTIHPDHWDVHGGPGTIVYFAPLQALVVRASSEVHRNLSGGRR